MEEITVWVNGVYCEIEGDTSKGGGELLMQETVIVVIRFDGRFEMDTEGNWIYGDKDDIALDDDIKLDHDRMRSDEEMNDTFEVPISANYDAHFVSVGYRTDSVLILHTGDNSIPIPRTSDYSVPIPRIGDDSVSIPCTEMQKGDIVLDDDIEVDYDRMRGDDKWGIGCIVFRLYVLVMDSVPNPRTGDDNVLIPCTGVYSVLSPRIGDDSVIIPRTGEYSVPIQRPGKYSVPIQRTGDDSVPIPRTRDYSVPIPHTSDDSLLIPCICDYSIPISCIGDYSFPIQPIRTESNSQTTRVSASQFVHHPSSSTIEPSSSNNYSLSANDAPTVGQIYGNKKELQ
ncbi:hypothetical protein FNV43_RR00436 [Rhamnella rubrinervis]|uniref:Uncharacterized protein n=1 Tax=Rhamnella rubrinervis TaxID=2594499 RepID=A0A8K0MRX4_9ROSA|nr:hypothetical protein FNV43_RR00436 [Rhamnella rubrinervis]